MTEKPGDTDSLKESRFLLAVLAAAVGIVASCGIVYQLVIGTISTYLLGNSTFQYSLTIGLFMSAYGIGSFLSTRITRNLTDWFAAIEIALGFFGGIASLVLFYLYATSELFQVGRVGLIAIIGTLVGLEIPLLIRISEEYRENLRVTVGQMMGFDYVGALAGGLAFPLLLVPVWGILGSSFLVGIGNSIVALAVVWFFRHRLAKPKVLGAACVAVAMVLSVASLKDRAMEQWIERSLYEDPIVYLEQTPYQRVVVTEYKDDLRLYLDGSLQFSAADEYRYHEVLVHSAASRMSEIDSVLVLGGGDGLVLRELQNYPEIDTVTLVDLDPTVVELARTNASFQKLNANAFERLEPEVVHADAFTWLQENDRKFDLIIIDLPDPHHDSLAKLYSVTFYASVREHLTDDGAMIAQLGSPFFARNTYWTGVRTMERAGLAPRPLHVQVPSFGEWGFAIGGPGAALQPIREFSGRYYDTSRDARHFDFPRDMQPPATLEPNTLMRPIIVERFREDWRRWN